MGSHSLTLITTVPGSSGWTVAVRTHTWSSRWPCAVCPSIEITVPPETPAAAATWLAFRWWGSLISTAWTANEGPYHSQHSRTVSSPATPAATARDDNCTYGSLSAFSARIN